MKSCLLLGFAFFFSNSYGQIMYLDSTNRKVEVTTHLFTTVNNEELVFDYYRAEGLSASLPLLIYVHGGGFSSGQHDSKGIAYFSKRMAQRGYAVASVEYRLTMKDIGLECDVTAAQKRQAFDDASYDVMRAVEHILKNNAATFKINQQKVVLIGSSAGAEAVLNLAYAYDYGEVLNGFRFAGVISMAGALTDLDVISPINAIPTQLFHGTGDALIPYLQGPHHYCDAKEAGFLMLYGSGPIVERLKGAGASYYLYTINGGSHGWAAIPMNKCIKEMVDFLYYDVLNSKGLRQTERTVSE